MSLAMVIAVEAVYENGVLRLKQPLPLADKAEVRVTIETAEPATAEDDPTGWKALKSLIGVIEDAPADMAENHDHYLYGFPRR